MEWRVEGDSLLAMYRRTRGAGFWRRGETADCSRYLRAFGGLLTTLYYLKGQKVRALIGTGFSRCVPERWTQF